MTNQEIAMQLREQGQRLAEYGDNLYRIRAYRRAVMAVQMLDVEIADVLEREGRRGVERLPGLGQSLANRIAVLVETGTWPAEERTPVAQAS